jgi:hypothetical protein
MCNRKINMAKKPESRNLIIRPKEKALHKAGDFAGGLLLKYPAMSVLYLLALRQTVFNILNGIFGIN